MGTHEPFCEKWSVFALDVDGESEEVSQGGAPAPPSTAVARPGGSSGDVDVVVAGNLLPRRNVSSCHDKRAVALVQHISIGVAAVIDVPIRGTQQNDLAIGVIAVVGSFTKFFPQRRARRDLPHDIDLANALPNAEASDCKQSQTFN